MHIWTDTQAGMTTGTNNDWSLINQLKVSN